MIFSLFSFGFFSQIQKSKHYKRCHSKPNVNTFTGLMGLPPELKYKQREGKIYQCPAGFMTWQTGWPRVDSLKCLYLLLNQHNEAPSLNNEATIMKNEAWLWLERKKKDGLGYQGCITKTALLDLCIDPCNKVLTYSLHLKNKTKTHSSRKAFPWDHDIMHLHLVVQVVEGKFQSIALLGGIVLDVLVLWTSCAELPEPGCESSRSSCLCVRSLHLHREDHWYVKEKRARKLFCQQTIPITVDPNDPDTWE